MDRIDALYRHRFSEGTRQARDRIWRVLCDPWFRRFVRSTDTLLDLSCGYVEFSRAISAGRKIAVDLNPEAALGLPPDVEFHFADASRPDFLTDGALDVCFTSNFFEHLPTKTMLNAVLAEVHRALKPGGLLVATGPSIRYVPGAYGDFYDHHIPLSHMSCAEALGKSNFEVIETIDRFLPLTSRSAILEHPALVRLYLAFRPAWRLLGKQFLVVGRKAAGAPRLCQGGAG